MSNTPVHTEEALFSIPSHKVVGLDDMTRRFFKHPSKPARDDFIGMIPFLLQRGFLLKELNQTIIALISKGISPIKGAQLLIDRLVPVRHQNSS